VTEDRKELRDAGSLPFMDPGGAYMEVLNFEIEFVQL
jgi:hypothetical protein